MLSYMKTWLRVRVKTSNRRKIIKPPINASPMYQLILLAFISLIASPTKAIEEWIPDYKEKFPKWGQKHDFLSYYDKAPTDLQGTDDIIPLYYDQLAGDDRVKIKNRDTFGLFKGQNLVDFTPMDFTQIHDGSYHCAPASFAMVLSWYTNTGRLKKLKNPTELNYIQTLAFLADTNDLNPHLNNKVKVGHFGTISDDMVRAVNKYLKAAYVNGASIPKVGVWVPEGPLDFAGSFMKLIDKDRPLVIFYRPNKDSTIGHAIVGVGYNDKEGIIVDPLRDEGMREQKIQVNEIVSETSPATLIWSLEDVHLQQELYRGFGARIHVIEIPDWGDAPSSYLLDKPAFHFSGIREWLGNSVTGEIDPLTSDDDPDGVANVNDFDLADDGIKFLDLNADDGIGSLVASISSYGGISPDPSYEQDQDPYLSLRGWIDWNRDSTWDESELIVDSLFAADFSGTEQYGISFAIPRDALGDYWARFRLSRGEQLGPYGPSLFGEIEDYKLTVVPAPPAYLGLLWLWRQSRRIRRMLSCNRFSSPCTGDRAKPECCQLEFLLIRST